MAEGGKRRRVVKNPDDAARETPSVFDASLSTPLTPAEKRSWDGFCEIESEPVCAIQNRDAMLVAIS